MIKNTICTISTVVAFICLGLMLIATAYPLYLVINHESISGLYEGCDVQIWSLIITFVVSVVVFVKTSD